MYFWLTGRLFFLPIVKSHAAFAEECEALLHAAFGQNRTMRHGAAGPVTTPLALRSQSGVVSGWRSHAVTSDIAKSKDQKQFILEIEFVWLFSVKSYVYF